MEALRIVTPATTVTCEVISSLIYNPACQHYFCVMAIATRSLIVPFFATSRPSARS